MAERLNPLPRGTDGKETVGMLKHSLLLSLHSNHQPILSPKCLNEVVPWERREKRMREVPSDECGHGSQTLVLSETLVTQDSFWAPLCGHCLGQSSLLPPLQSRTSNAVYSL